MQERSVHAGQAAALADLLQSKWEGGSVTGASDVAAPTKAARGMVLEHRMNKFYKILADPVVRNELGGTSCLHSFSR